MKDITPFLSTSNIKPELAHIYVHDGIAVATDSYRLAEIKLDDFCKENIPNGYYEKKKWQAMCKAYNKKTKDITAFMHAIIENNAVMQEKSKDYNYPDYKQIIPQENTLTPFTNDMKFNKVFLSDFMELMQHPLHVDFSLIKTNNKMIMYQDNTITLLLMKIDR
jgi:hypothetical protein